MDKIKLDETDFAILDALQENARQSIFQIAKKIIVPPTTIHNRIKKLRENGVISRYTIDIDREKIARHGLTIEDVQTVISSALGGEELTTTVEGKERYTVNVRYLRELRDSPEKIKNIYVESPLGYQIPLAQLAVIKLENGPMQIKDEDASLVGYVYIDIENRDVGSYVEDAKKLLEKELNLQKET